MAKYRVWYGDDPTYKKVSSLAEAIKFIKKRPELDESNSGIEEETDVDFWDEWLDEDDQNVHEHLYMYGGKSKFLRVVDEDEDDLDDDDEEEDEDDDIDDDEDEVDEDLDERLMDVIGGGRSATQDAEDSFDDEEDDDLDDDEDDLDDDLDDDEDEDEI